MMRRCIDSGQRQFGMCTAPDSISSGSRASGRRVLHLEASKHREWLDCLQTAVDLWSGYVGYVYRYSQNLDRTQLHRPRNANAHATIRDPVSKSKAKMAHMHNLDVCQLFISIHIFQFQGEGVNRSLSTLSRPMICLGQISDLRLIPWRSVREPKFAWSNFWRVTVRLQML